MHSACRGHDSQLYESTYTSAASLDGWTRFTYIRKNATKHAAKSEAVVTNVGKSVVQLTGRMLACLLAGAQVCLPLIIL